MSILPKVIYRVNTIPTEMSMDYFTELELIFQKFIGNHTRPPNSYSNPKKEE